MMEQVSTSAIAAMVATLIITVGFPVVLLLIFRKKMGKGVTSAFLAGALGFFIPQVVIRIPALQGLALLDGFTSFAQNHFWIYAVLIALSAGVFETTGRLVVFKTVLKNRTTYNAALCAGLGHGGIEAAYLVGLTYVNNLVLSFMINNGSAFDVLTGQGLAPDQANQLIATMTQTSTATFYMAGFERVFTIGFHIGLSLLLAYGINKKQTMKFFVLVMLLHTTFDFAVIAAQRAGWSPYVIESIVALVGLVAIYFTIRIKSGYDEIEIKRDEAEIAREEGY
jgi:uncharacterized membrane protein YhfC